MTMGTILKNGKPIRVAALHAYINLYSGNNMGTITWENGNTNVSLHIVNHI